MANVNTLTFVAPEIARPIVLLGATAVGKSEIALALARQHRAVILSLDAMQVYREADLGTGKSSVAERQEILHGGLDLTEFGARFDVADYLRHAQVFLEEQARAGRPVILVGGTGLYFRALTRGLCLAPEAPLELRRELAQLSLPELQERLRRCDAPMLARVDRQNPRRLARAIAVMEGTGRSLAVWQAETPPPLLPHFTAYWLQRDKADLQERIGHRIEAMWQAGWLEEVRGLLERHGDRVRTFPAIGYRDIADFLLGGGHDQGLLKKTIRQATEAYAKRQLTWLGSEPNLILVTMNPSPSAGPNRP